MDKHILLDKIDSIRHSQVGTDNEEFIPGMVACAVPIPNGDNPVLQQCLLMAPQSVNP